VLARPDHRISPKVQVAIVPTEQIPARRAFAGTRSTLPHHGPYANASHRAFDNPQTPGKLLRFIT
jgi:hypothetical protein